MEVSKVTMRGGVEELIAKLKELAERADER